MPAIQPTQHADSGLVRIQERLLAAADRLERGLGGTTLRDDQLPVLRDASTYLLDLATRPASEASPRFGRIVQPPRTGKTVIAAEVIGRAGLACAFLVPTRALVAQTVREMRARLPAVPVGMFCGESKDVVEDGVNVSTYAMMVRAAKKGNVPEAIRRSALVFADEAHRAMTPARMAFLEATFDPAAPRIALTATPDYDETRRLAGCFPDLIHEVGLAEALALDLLAPLRVWVAEVDADGSVVQFVAGDFEPETLGRLMSSAPFFKAVEAFRYAPESAALPALIACASRQQAYDLVAYLGAHRPAGRPAPGLILGETPPERREALLARFERGDADTLVQVGVLIEGWNSPRCKLLLDLAPSLSRVRATQKYFRVMTRLGSAEARVYVLVPRNLPRMPILPMDLFGLRGEYRCGEVVGREWAPSLRGPVDRMARTPVEGVRLRDRVLVTARIDKPLLDPGDDSAIRRVVESCPSFDARRPCGVLRFAWFEFAHPLFAGRGDFLLAWLRVARTREAYRAFIGRLYPEAMGSLLLEEEDGATEEVECAEDVARLATATERPSEKGIPEEPFASSWAALRGGWDAPQTPEELLLARERIDLVLAVVDGLAPRQARTLRARFGIPREAERALGEIACDEGVSRARIHQIEKEALRRLRQRAFIAACARERQEECSRVRFAQSNARRLWRLTHPRAAG